MVSFLFRREQDQSPLIRLCLNSNMLVFNDVSAEWPLLINCQPTLHYLRRSRLEINPELCQWILHCIVVLYIWCIVTYSTSIFVFLPTGSMDLLIASPSSPPHVSVILSAVRVLPLLQALTQIILKCDFAFMMRVLVKSFLCKKLCGGYLTLVIAVQGQSVAVWAHHRPLPPRRRQAEEALLPGESLIFHIVLTFLPPKASQLHPNPPQQWQNQYW